MISVMYIFKQFLILLVSLFLMAVMFFLMIVLPAVIELQFGIDNPPPPFDIGPHKIYFTNPALQLPVVILILLTPLFGTLIAFLLNGLRKNKTVFIPAALGYLIFTLFLISYYFTDAWIVRY